MLETICHGRASIPIQRGCSFPLRVARFSISLCNDGAMQGRPRSSCANCSGSRASRPRRLSPISSALMGQPRRNWACRLATSKACGRTTGPRIRIYRCDDASGRCSVLNRLGQRNASCLYKPPSRIRSTFSAILFPANTLRVLRGEALQNWRAATAA